MSEGLNKTLLKKFAVDSREELIEKIKLKANIYGITKEISDKDRKTKGQESFISNDNVVIDTNEGSRTLSNDEKFQRTELIKKIQRINKEGRDGFDEVIEEVAYTWFNRFVALRYMEINGFLPSRINILASKDNTNVPEVLTEAMNVSLPIDRDLVYELKKSNKNEELYRYLVELQCSELNKTLPFIFEKVGHFAELLFPAGIIMSKFFKTLVDTESITEEAWSNVEIIGWLYQYYISTEKDRVIKAKKKYKKNEIPFATQLFTPDWIVRYMVQNALGRYWVESHEEDNDLKENWEFYLENPEKEPDFDEKIAPYINKDLNVEDIKCFDPACGSGHILVYMFDILYEIYTRCAYSKSEIPMLIIEKNLYGLDIDMRAYQLACFAVIMKGMSYDKLLLRKIGKEVDSRGKYIDLNIACVKETNILFEDEEITLHDNVAFLANEQSGETYDKVKLFVESLKNANTFGSLAKVEGFDKEFLEKRLEEVKNNPATDIFTSKSSELWKSILEDLIKQSSIMEKTYDVLVTNPPYMGSKYMNPILMDFIKDSYKDTKSDLFSAFMEYCLNKVDVNGQLGFMTPYVWMFISSYKSLREYIIKNKNITSLIQLEYSAFEEATVPICTFALRNSVLGLNSEYIRLADFKGGGNQKIKVLEAIENDKVNYRYNIDSLKFLEMPGAPLAYWVSENIVKKYKECENIEKFSDYSGAQNKTANNEKYLRKQWEINNKDIGQKWIKIAKGGSFRKWYGNMEEVIDWSLEAKQFYKANKTSCIMPEKYLFRKGVCWTKITSVDKPSFRLVNDDSLYETAAPTIHFDENYGYFLGLLNSIIGENFVKITKQTLNFQVFDIVNIPVKLKNEEINCINVLVSKAIKISKKDWDELEISNDFQNNAIMDSGIKKLIDATKELKSKNIKEIKELKSIEEEINKKFIEIYDLSYELSYKVDIKNITLKEFDLNNEIKSLLSYFIGCLSGRYLLNEAGVKFAGGVFNIESYSKFIPDSNNIIPILNSETSYFEDDVMVRFEEFLKVAFSEEYLAENIDFIAEALGKKTNESSKETIRKYFVNEFFTEHCKMYKKRPIYWLFTSGKNKAFNCLVYQHRIDKNLLSKMRIDYVQPLQNKLDTEFKDLTDTMNSDAPAKDKKDAKKKLNLAEKQIAELKVYHEKLKHMADKQIEIDLDDGVIYNHGLFGDLVAKIK